MTPISKAIDVAGSVNAFAAAIAVPVQSVYFWRSGERRVPADYCPRIEEATGGLVRCEDLRPDVRWDVLRNPAPAQGKGVANV